jgi:hypothetical protein
MPRRYTPASRWLLPLIALAIAISILWPVELAAQTVRFSVLPNMIQVETGDEFEVDVIISDAIDLYGIQFDLAFDPAILQVMDTNPNSSGIQVMLGDFPFPDFVALHEVDNLEGRISYACTQMRPREPVSGSGTALIIRFMATGAGETQLLLQGALAATEDYDLDTTTTAGRVVVVQRAPTATTTADTGQVPTRTPLPTHTSAAGPATATATSPAMSATSAAAYPEAPGQQIATPSPPGWSQAETPLAEAATLEAEAQPSPTWTLAADEAPSGETESTDDIPTPAPIQETAEGVMTITPREAVVATGVEEPSPTKDVVAALLAPRAPDESIPLPERSERPLVSTEVFVCLSSGLVLFTALLIVYVAQRKRKPYGSSLR